MWAMCARKTADGNTTTAVATPIPESYITVLPHGDVDSWGAGFSVPIENSGGGAARATTTTKCPFNPTLPHG